MGPFITPEMAGGVRDLICDLRRTAEMADELKFLPTLETRWEVREKARAAPATDSNWSAVVAAGKDKPVVNAGATAAERRRAANAVAGALYTRNMHKAQWAVCEIMQDVVRAMEKWFDHELYSLFGFLACMIQTRWVDVQKVQTGEKMKILIAHEDAIPNGQVGSRILDELGEQLCHQGEQQFLEFYPPQLADMLKDEAAMRQLPIFLRGNAMEEFVLLDANGQVLLEDTKPLVKDANGDYIKQPVAAGPAPLWRFPELARRALKLYFCQLSSNDVERVLSLVARGYSGGGKNVGFRCISSWIRRRDWVSARFFRLEADPAFLEVYREARRLIRENNKGFQQAFALDINSSELRNRWRQQQNLPDYRKNGVRKFDKTNIVAGGQELLVGRKLDSNEQLSARVMNARKRQQIAVRLKAIKRSHVPRPRATAAVVQRGKRKRTEIVQRGKRKRTEIALPQYPQRSKRSRNDDADCGEDPNLVPAAHLNGMATVGTGITVAEARDAILSRTSPFGLHDRSVEQERVGKEDGSGKLTMRTHSWIMVPLIATAILGAEASAAFFPAFPADESGRAGFAFSKAVQAVRTLLDRRLGIEMERDDIVVNPKDNRTLYFSQRLQNAVLNAMRAGFSELFESLQRWILKRFEGERQAVAGEGCGANATHTLSQMPVAPGAADMLLLKALADAGINPRRVHNVRQPYPSSAALEHFQAKGIELAAAGVQRGDFANPAGHRWVLLAMPGEDQDQRYAEAARLFHTPDLCEDLLKPIEVCLASAEYSGVCVLARALLGSGLSSYALYADGFKSLDQSQQTQGDFWIITSLGQTQTFRCVFRSLHQLLPIYTIIMSAWDGDREGTFPAPAKLGNSFSVPGNDCTDPDFHSELATLKLENSKLETENSLLKGKLARVRRKRKCETNKAGRTRKRDDMAGCQRVTIAELAVGVTGLEGVELVDSDEPALGGGSAAKKRPRRVQGEVAQDTLFIESKGGKAIRRATSGKKVGGLEWKDSVMAGAVASWALHSLSFKAAGKTVNAGLRIQGVRFWFKAEPRRHYKSRRRKNATPEIPLRDISTPSMRDGVFAMDLAKNSWFYEKLVKADAVALCVDYGSVADKSFQASHLRTFRFQDGGTDGAGTMWLTVIADSMVLDVWPVGDKKLEEASYTGEAGEQRRLPVEAPRALAAQLIYAGIYWIIMRCRCLSLTFDGGGEGSGLGNKKLARENMAGKHSYMDLVWLERSAADSAFEMLNKVNLFVALMEFYGYDWEAGEFLTRRQDTKNSLAPEAEVTRQPSVRLDLTGDPESAADEARPPPRSNAKRPIFDPLGGPQDPATLRMSFFDFVVWDIARAYPYLGLAETARGVTEDMVARTERFMTCSGTDRRRHPRSTLPYLAKLI